MTCFYVLLFWSSWTWFRIFLLLYYFVVQVFPSRIQGFYKIYFPFTMPILELFLSSDSSFYIITILIIDESFAVVFCSKRFFINNLFMFRDSPNEVGSNSDIEYSISLVCSDVDVSWIHIRKEMEDAEINSAWREKCILLFYHSELALVIPNLFRNLLMNWNEIWRCWIESSMTSNYSHLSSCISFL